MLNLKLDEILTGELKAIYNVARKTAEQRAKAEAEEDKAMTQELLAILDEIEAVQAVHEEVDFIDELDAFMIQEEQPKVEVIDTFESFRKPIEEKIEHTENKLNVSLNDYVKDFTLEEYKILSQMLKERQN